MYIYIYAWYTYIYIYMYTYAFCVYADIYENKYALQKPPKFEKAELSSFGAKAAAVPLLRGADAGRQHSAAGQHLKDQQQHCGTA